MKNYITPLWLLFWSVAIGLVVSFVSNEIAMYSFLLASVTANIIAVVQLSSRNRRLQKSKKLMIASFVTLLILIAQIVIMYRIGEPDSLAPWVGLTMFAIFLLATYTSAILTILGSFQQLYGLAEMAEEANEKKHARAVRHFFIYHLISTAILVGIQRMDDGGAVVGKVIKYALAAVSVYRLYLYYRSIGIERAHEARIVAAPVKKAAPRPKKKSKKKPKP